MRLGVEDDELRDDFLREFLVDVSVDQDRARLEHQRAEVFFLLRIVFLFVLGKYVHRKCSD